MKRPPRLFSEQRATQAELLEHIQQLREYSAYLEGRLGIVDTAPVAARRTVAVGKKTAYVDKKDVQNPNEVAELLARSMLRIFRAEEPKK